MSIGHTFTLRRPSSGQDTGEIENEEGEYYKTGRPDTHTSTDSSAVLSLNTSSHLCYIGTEYTNSIQPPLTQLVNYAQQMLPFYALD